MLETKITNYTYEDMIYIDNNLDIGIKDFSLIRDYVIKEILNRNPKVYKKMLVLLIKDVIDLGSEKTNIVYGNTELGKSNYKERNKTVDSYVILNDKIHIDLECNTSLYEYSKLRNILYLNKLSTKLLEIGNNPSRLKDLILIQVNINASKYDKDYGYEAFSYVGKKSNKKLTDFQNILVFNIEYFRNLFYNLGVKLKKSEMWLVVLSSKNFTELYESLGYVVTTKERNKLIKDVVNMFADGFSLQNWEREKMIELVRSNQIDSIKEAERAAGIEEGRVAGIEEGIQKNITNTIITMLKEKCSFDLISKITGKTKEEIISIQKSMI